MSKLVATALLLSLAIHGTDVVTAWDDEDFFRYCPPSQCSEHGPEIRFPFRLESSNTSSSCGAPCMKLACSGQDTILDNQYLGRFKVTAIDYRHAVLTIIPLVETMSPCPLQKLISTSVPVGDMEEYEYHYHGPCDTYFTEFATLVCCLREFTPTNRTADYIAGPISCLSTVSHFSYLVPAYLPISFLPLDCKGLSDGLIRIPSANITTDELFDASTFKERAERILSFAETTVRWLNYDDCTQCELEGRRCAFSTARNQTFCMHHGSHVKVIAGEEDFEPDELVSVDLGDADE